jgi:hypothetical protein
LRQVQLRLDELRLSFAKIAAPFNAFCDEAKETLTAGWLGATGVLLFFGGFLRKLLILPPLCV